jgi:uncharacterized membrane protein
MHDREAASDRAPGRREALPLDRFNAFSDGVLAIAITLLVLELTVPAATGGLLASLREEWTEFLGYLISFAFIGGMWVGHAQMTSLMKQADTVAAGLNLLVLLFIGLLPFTTSLMVGNLSGPDVEAAVVIYGINVLVASLGLTLLMVYLVRERALLVDDVADDTLATLARRRWVLNGIWAAAVVVAVVQPTVAVGLYVLAAATALVFPLVGLRLTRRRAPSPRA